MADIITDLVSVVNSLGYLKDSFFTQYEHSTPISYTNDALTMSLELLVLSKNNYVFP